MTTLIKYFKTHFEKPFPKKCEVLKIRILTFLYGIYWYWNKPNLSPMKGILDTMWFQLHYDKTDVIYKKGPMNGSSKDI